MLNDGHKIDKTPGNLILIAALVNATFIIECVFL
jgi:hypothetical protein